MPLRTSMVSRSRTMEATSRVISNTIPGGARPRSVST